MPASLEHSHLSIYYNVVMVSILAPPVKVYKDLSPTAAKQYANLAKESFMLTVGCHKYSTMVCAETPPN